MVVLEKELAKTPCSKINGILGYEMHLSPSVVLEDLQKNKIETTVIITRQHNSLVFMFGTGCHLLTQIGSFE